MIGINNNCNVRGTSSTSTHREPSSQNLSVPRGSNTRVAPPRGSNTRGAPPRGNSTRATPPPPSNPFSELVTQAFESNLMKPVGIASNKLRSSYVPMTDIHGETIWVCCLGIACELNMTNSDGRITCRSGSSNCCNNHIHVCRHHLNGTCHFVERCTLPHLKLWSKPVAAPVAAPVSDHSSDVLQSSSANSYAGAALRAPLRAPVAPVAPVAPRTAQVSEPLRTHTQLCKLYMDTHVCKHERKCMYAHDEASIRPTREVEYYLEFLSNPDANQEYFEDLRAALVRLSMDPGIIRFCNADKADIFLHVALPGPNQFGELLKWWGNTCSRVRSMNQDKLALPSGITKKDMPSFELFPDDESSNWKQDVAWVLVSRMKLCTKENCMFGINCRTGVHNKSEQITTAYLEGTAEPNSTQRDAMNAKIENLLTQKKSIDARRDELKAEKLVSGYRRSDREIEKDQTQEKRRAAINDSAISNTYLKKDFEEFPRLRVWTGTPVAHVNRPINPSEFSTIKITKEMRAEAQVRKEQDLLNAPIIEAARVRRQQIRNVCNMMTKLLRSKMPWIMKQVTQAAKKFHEEYQRKLCDFEERWNNLGIERTVVVSKDGETSDVNECYFDSEIKKMFYNAEDWMNNCSKWSNKEFVGTYSDVIGDSDIVNAYESSTYPTFVKFVDTSPRVKDSIVLMRQSGYDYSTCSKYISTRASVHRISIEQFAVDQLSYTKYIKYIDFFSTNDISFEKFSKKTDMYCAYALSNSDVSFEEFLANINSEEGFVYIPHKKRNVPVFRDPTELDAKTYKKLAAREPVEGFWYVDGVQVAEPVTEKQIASFNAIQKLRTAQCITDVRKYYDIVAKTYTSGKIMDDAKSRLEKDEIEASKVVVEDVVEADSDSDSASDSDSDEDDFDESYFGCGKFEDQMPEPLIGSYQGLRGYKKPYYLISTRATGKSFAHFGPFKTKEEANNFKKSHGSKKLSTNSRVTCDKDEDGNIICYNVSLNVTASRKSDGNLHDVIAFLSKCATNSGILGNQVAVQYIKQSDKVFHNDEDKSLVEIEMNRLHVLLPKVAVYDSDSDSDCD